MADEDAGSKSTELHVAGIVHVAIGLLMMQISHKVSYKEQTGCYIIYEYSARIIIPNH
jgi:hypothetical protein